MSITDRQRKAYFYKAKKSNQAGELDFTYYNAVYTVENALAKVRDEKGMKRVEKFLKEDVCPECMGSRLSEAARAPRLRGIGLAEACKMTLKELVEWVAGVPETLPEEMRPMAESICESFQTVAKRLMDWDFLTFRWTGRHPRCLPGKDSVCSLPEPCVTGQRE